MLPVAVARSSSDGVVIRLLCWPTSGFTADVMFSYRWTNPMDTIKHDVMFRTLEDRFRQMTDVRQCLVDFVRMWDWGEICYLQFPCCFCICLL